jgi:hypothetical protein
VLRQRRFLVSGARAKTSNIEPRTSNTIETPPTFALYKFPRIRSGRAFAVNNLFAPCALRSCFATFAFFAVNNPSPPCPYPSAPRFLSFALSSRISTLATQRSALLHCASLLPHPPLHYSIIPLFHSPTVGKVYNYYRIYICVSWTTK